MNGLNELWECSHVWGSNAPPWQALSGRLPALAGSSGCGSRIVSPGCQRWRLACPSGPGGCRLCPAGGGSGWGCRPASARTPSPWTPAPPGLAAVAWERTDKVSSWNTSCGSNTLLYLALYYWNAVSGFTGLYKAKHNVHTHHKNNKSGMNRTLGQDSESRCLKSLLHAKYLAIKNAC